MKKFATLICAFALAATPTLAQSEKPGPREEPNLRGGSCLAIVDDGYDGTIGSMTCIPLAADSGIVLGVTSVSAAIEHTFVGDLTMKLVSPNGTVTTLQSRAGTAEPGDDGTAPPFGDGDNMVSGFPVTYLNGAATSAEDMGAAGGDICAVDGICEYFPFPDTGPGIDLSDFDGEDVAGDWMLCVGDSAGFDTGEVCPTGSGIAIEFEAAASPTEVPTASTWGLLALLGLIAGAGVMYLRR